MKKIAIILVSFTTLIQAPAQLFSPESLHGAMWGGLIGGMVGSDPCHGLSGKTAAIGAGVGLIAGALAGEARRNDYLAGQPYNYVPAPSISFGYGYGSCGGSAYVYYSPNSYCAPGYYYHSTRPNYAVSGRVLGAASIVPSPETPNSTITSTPVATSTYTWTTRPQIADAPSVPDAPTF